MIKILKVTAYPALGNSPRISVGEPEIPVDCNCACVPQSPGEPVMLACDPRVPALNRNYVDVPAVLAGRYFPSYSPAELERVMAFEQQRNMARTNNMNYDGIIDIGSVWFWLQHGLLPYLWKETSFVAAPASSVSSPSNGTSISETAPPVNANDPLIRAGRLGYTNQIIGGMRLVQGRRATAPCEVSDKLQEFYGAQCRGGDLETSDYGRGIAAGHPSFKPTAEEGIFHAYFDIGNKLTEEGGALDEISHYLKPANWVDGMTE